ncbi:MAG TPA: membrane protein insertase YidC [Xanthomonadaceae bacterium]|nr:membrane protein insertase YidC [Xanthomonadaceae bacterium]
MNQFRTILLIAWIGVAFLLWQAWQQDHAAPPGAAADPAPTAAPPVIDPAAIPEPPDAMDPAMAARDAPPAPGADAATGVGAAVVVSTDVLRVEIDPRGGTVQRADLLRYPDSTQDGAEPVQLLAPAGPGYFVAQSGWVSRSHPAPSHEDAFTTEGMRHALAEDAEQVLVPFLWRGDGVEVRRTYVFERGSYAIGVREEVRNLGPGQWQGSPYRQLQRVPPAGAKRNLLASPEAFSFVGAAWYSPEHKFNKLDFDEFLEEPVQATLDRGWVAMLQHYFFAAWIPDPEQQVAVATAQLGGSRHLIRTVGETVRIGPGESVTRTAQLYVGPKLQDELEDVAPGLGLTIDYGIFTVLAQPLFWLLSLLHSLLRNWGWAIVALVVLIKLAFFKLSEAQYRSFAKLRTVQPRIEALKERYGEDKQKFQQAMIELYRKEKINPAGGCLPILVQIPVFIALYWVLVESVELRHATWIPGWIDDLTARDPYFILPALNMFAMWATQKLSPAPGMDPIQRRMMQAMPFVFGIMFAFFPAGLVLYWATNGTLGLLQQWLIMRRHGVQVRPRPAA